MITIMIIMIMQIMIIGNTLLSPAGNRAPPPSSRTGFRLNNLRFNESQKRNVYSAAPVAISFVSSEIMKCRLLKSLSDHPMNSW